MKKRWRFRFLKTPEDVWDFLNYISMFRTTDIEYRDCKLFIVVFYKCTSDVQKRIKNGDLSSELRANR